MAQNSISELLTAQKVHKRAAVRKVASFVGQIVSISIVIGHISKIMTRYLSTYIYVEGIFLGFIYIAFISGTFVAVQFVLYSVPFSF